MTEDPLNDEAIASDETKPIESPERGNASGEPRSGELAGTDASIELVEYQRELIGTGVTLSGGPARELIEAVAPMAKELARGGKTIAGEAQEATGQLYRIVPRRELAEGLKKNALRMGTPRKGGDATVLVKHAKSGRIAGRADLVKANEVKAVPSAMKALGPVAWQAMAMATQQHYLVEINDKLADLGKGVDEILARQSDEKRSAVEELRDEAARIRSKIEQGRPVDPDQLEQYLHAGGRVQRELALTAERAADNYLKGELPAQEVEDAFSLAMFAAQTLAELSGVYVSLPSRSAEDLQFRIDGEFGRLEPRRELLRGIARTLNRAHRAWEMHSSIYENEKRPRARVLQEFNKISPKKIGGEAPPAIPLSDAGAKLVRSLLALSAPEPESLLLEIGDGEVRVAVEAERASDMPRAPTGTTEEDIDEAVTRYSDGTWWVDGRFGPYKTREGAVARLRSL
jgi:hypothetical protein